MENFIMYKCLNCGKLFDEPTVERINAADYFGVEKNGREEIFNIEECPYCGSEDIEEIDDEEDDEEEDEEEE